MKFEAQSSSLISNSDPSIITSWEINPNVIVFAQNKLDLQIEDNSQNMNILSTSSEITITCKYENSTHAGEQMITLPLNKPPTKKGSITINPQNGDPLQTEFTFEVSNAFQDTDGKNKPFTFKIQVAPNSAQEYIDFASTFTTSSNFKTVLPGNGVSTIRVFAYDFQGLDTGNTSPLLKSSEYVESSVNFTIISQDTLNFVKDLNQIVEDPQKQAQVMAAIKSSNLSSEELESFQKVITPPPSNDYQCTDCSGHGTCSNGVCNCEPGWTLHDCSMSEADKQKAVETKLKMIEELDNSFKKDPTPEEKTKIIGTLDLLTDNPAFNTNKAMEKVDKILTDQLKLDGEETILTKDQAQLASGVLDNMLEYAGDSCGKDQKLVRDLSQKTDKYLETLTRSSLKDASPGDNATIMTQDSFDVYSKRVTECELAELQLSTGKDAPQATFQKKGQLDCTKTVDVKYYVFKDGLFDCDNKNKSSAKTGISVQIYDSKTGKEVSDDYSMEVKMPQGTNCPNSCDKNDVGVCKCADIGGFDLKNQIGALFANSMIGKLGNLGALSDWRYWESFAFYAISLISILLIATIYIVKFKIPNYSIANNRFKGERISICKRLMTMLAFSSIFGTSDSVESFGGFMKDSFNPYMVFLPYLTIIPLNAFFECLVAVPSLEKKKRQKFPCLLRLRKIIAFVVGSFLIFGSIFSVIVLAANKTPEQNASWKYDFAFSFSQDLLFNPLVYIILQYGVFLFAYKNPPSKSTKVEKFLKKKFVDKSIAKNFYYWRSNPKSSPSRKRIKAEDDDAHILDSMQQQNSPIDEESPSQIEEAKSADTSIEIPFTKPSTRRCKRFTYNKSTKWNNFLKQNDGTQASIPLSEKLKNRLSAIQSFNTLKATKNEKPEVNDNGKKIFRPKLFKIQDIE